MNLRPLPPQGSALPAAPHPETLGFASPIIITQRIALVKGLFLFFLIFFCFFQKKTVEVVKARGEILKGIQKYEKNMKKKNKKRRGARQKICLSHFCCNASTIRKLAPKQKVQSLWRASSLERKNEKIFATLLTFSPFCATNNIASTMPLQKENLL